MPKTSFLLLPLCALLTAPVWAVPPDAPSPPAAAQAPALPAAALPPQAPPQVYAPRPPEPVVNPDGSITFSLSAPAAKDVQLEGQAGTGPMTLDDKGVWTFRSAPLAPEIYEYHFVVDGLTLTDPRNTWTRGTDASLVDVPARGGTPPQPWEETDVPHGAVTTAYYPSAAAGGVQRRVHIYTPARIQCGQAGHVPDLLSSARERRRRCLVGECVARQLHL